MQRRKEALELEREGRYAEAIQKFEEVIALNPTAQNSAIRKGRCWERLGNRAKALESYRQAIEMDPLTYDASEATYRALKVAFAEGDTST
ncbi:MAG: tetratricopeptide repeat protein, partial [Thermofilum sp.]